MEDGGWCALAMRCDALFAGTGPIVKIPSDGGMEGWKGGRVVRGVAIRFRLYRDYPASHSP